ncbi:MAG: alanine racemase [Oscillospiraceae bacterium]|nr:alanine racemase [Oscillospiraceae bacterium]
MESTLRRTWAEIDLDALEHNYRTLRAHVGQNVKFLGVVKADSYGHGCIHISRLLQELGADYLAVSSIDEAIELRVHDITLPILILGYTPADQVGNLIDYRITQAITSPEAARAYSTEAVRHGGELLVHMKVDTGMSRVGFLCQGGHFEQAVADITEACRLPGLCTEGIFTHFAVSDEPDKEESVIYTRNQLELFRRTIAAVEEKWGQRFALHHCSNTGATALWPDAWMDMIRPGLLLYGCGEFAEQLGLKPVMRLKTSVSIIKTYDPGTTVSYGRMFKAERTTRMGVVPYGYADGFFRTLSNRCRMMTADGPAPQRGRICMDMCMIDLTDLPDVKEGDEVEIFGEHISVNEVAALAGTISYEITCAVSKRVPRVYLRHGQVVGKELMLRF